MKKQRFLGLFGLAMPVAAVVGFLFAAPSAYLKADSCSCFHNGKEESYGGCITDGCPPDTRQQCTQDGWGGCTTDCPKLPPCA